jgi:hypothetical protein
VKRKKSKLESEVECKNEITKLSMGSPGYISFLVFSMTGSSPLPLTEKPSGDGDFVFKGQQAYDNQVMPYRVIDTEQSKVHSLIPPMFTYDHLTPSI